MSPSETVQAENIERVVELLKPAAKPLTFAYLKKAARLGDAELKSALEAAVKQNAAFRWPDYRKSQYFWGQSPDQAAQQAVLAMASDEALSGTKLIAGACKRIPGFSKKAMQQIVVNLVAGHELQPVPGFTTGKLLIRTGNAAAYAASARKFIEDKFRKAGLDPAPLLAPGPSKSGQPAPEAGVDATAQIMAAVRSLEPVVGVPVSAQRLRNYLPALNKHDFDGAALDLRKSEQAALSLHHDPHNLPQPERDLLIDGGDGTYYVAIAIRR